MAKFVYQPRPATPEERDMLDRLSKCTFVPRSWDKRFVRGLHGQIRNDSLTVTPRQAEYIGKLFYRYRRQTDPQ